VENLWNKIEAFGISLNLSQIEQLKIHHRLLLQWNSVHNLTTLRDDREIFFYHYLDCLLGLKVLVLTPEETVEKIDCSISPFEKGGLRGIFVPEEPLAIDKIPPDLPFPKGGEGIGENSVALYDLGSGAGFPGLIAAVLWPNQEIVLVESSKKKCSFLSLAASSMNLNRVKIVSERVEKLKNIQFAITRAAFSPENWSVLEDALAPNGKIAFWLSDRTLDIVRNNSNLHLEQESTYELEPGHQRKIALFVSRGTSFKKGIQK
jgi:16S rRNA G527 N7-methylase RsmG